LNKPYWECEDCPYKTKNEDEALKHSATVHPSSHRLVLIE